MSRRIMRPLTAMVAAVSGALLASVMLAGSVTAWAEGTEPEERDQQEASADPEATWRLDPPAEWLLMPDHRDENMRLIEESRRTMNLCIVMRLFEELDEPHPEDHEGLSFWAQRESGIASLLDRDSEVRDPDARGNQRIDLPQEVIDAMERRRFTVHVYHLRLDDLGLLVDAGLVDDDEAAARAEAAWVELAVSGYSRAVRDLIDARDRHC